MGMHMQKDTILIQGLRQNNLKNVSLEVPIDSLIERGITLS